MADIVHTYESKSWNSYFAQDEASDDFMLEREDIIVKRGVASGILFDIEINESIDDDESLQGEVDKD